MGGLMPVIDEALALATAIVNYMNLKESHKYIDNVRNVQLQIASEKNQDVHFINDAKIERLEEQLKIEFQALNTSINAGLSAAAPQKT